ncbi:MAG: UPF0158 family protein [bacterium]
MNRIKVERLDIIEAFEANNPSLTYFLNKESGEVIKVDEGFCADETISGIDYFSDPKYIRIPRISDREGLRIREEYLTRISNEDLCDRLEQILIGRGSLKRFVDILRVYPSYYEEWVRFKNHKIMKIIETWSKGLEIELDLVNLPGLNDIINKDN